MIEYISINIKNGGLTHTISIDTDIDGNLPYDLAEAFAEVIRLTNANPDIVVELLVNEYGSPEKEKNDKACMDDEVDSIWHDVTEEPRLNQYFLAQIGDYAFDTFIMAMDKNQTWRDWSNGINIKKWVYISDLLPKGGEK